MNDELKLIAKKLTAVFAANPNATRQALAEALPEAIRSLGSIAVGKDYTAGQRLKAVNTLLGLQARIVSEDLRRQNAAIKRREAECRIIEARVEGIKAKVERDAESRKKRASVAKAVRDIKAAKKIGTDAA